MKLYYSPGACSLSPHIVLAETGLNCERVKVDLRATPHTLPDGADFSAVNPKGSVPALLLDDGQLLTEGAVIVQYLADLAPQSGLIPPAGDFQRYRLQEWLNFVATDIHKGFGPLWMPNIPDALKTQTLDRLNRRFAVLDAVLGDNEYLMGNFSVADAYLFTCLNWTGFLKVSLEGYPHVQAYLQRVGARPAVKRAMQEEGLI
jgi:glutathione S-transferase